jgi:hypothetical protein
VFECACMCVCVCEHVNKDEKTLIWRKAWSRGLWKSLVFWLDLKHTWIQINFHQKRQRFVDISSFISATSIFCTLWNIWWIICFILDVEFLLINSKNECFTGCRTLEHWNFLFFLISSNFQFCHEVSISLS